VNIDISEIDAGPAASSKDEGPTNGKERRRGSSALAFLALLIALAALAGSAWLWWQDRTSAQQKQTLRAEVERLDRSDTEQARKLQALEDSLQTLSAGDGEDRFADLRQELASDRKRLEQLDRAMQEQLALTRSLQAAGESEHSRLAAAETALVDLSRRELDAPGELDMAEVDYLLRLASERLALFSDPKAADKALALADSHLAAIDNPAYLVVRQEIAAARQQLAAVDAPDPVAVAARIDAAQAAIPGLTFRGGESIAAGVEQSGEGGWWERLKSTLAGLVTIRRSDEEANPEISLQDKDFVRQRLWMQLEEAHLALQRRDQQAFGAAIARARKTVSTWFKPGSATVESFDQMLTELSGVLLRAAMPDISAPWSTLRLLRSGSGAQPAEGSDGPAPSQDSLPGEVSG